jgi:drug/metabolite transporter (DMT)-like permease
MATTDQGERRFLGDRIPPGIRYMAAAALFFSVMSLLVKSAGQRLPVQEVVLARSSVGAALSWHSLRRRGVPLWGQRRGLLLVRGLLGYAGLSCFFYALVHLPLAEATVIQYTNPVFTALLAVVFLSEHIRPRDLLLVGVSLGVSCSWRGPSSSSAARRRAWILWRWPWLWPARSSAPAHT